MRRNVIAALIGVGITLLALACIYWVAPYIERLENVPVQHSPPPAGPKGTV